MTAGEGPRSDAGNWAKPVGKLEVGEISAEALNRNVSGRRVTSPIQGFGKLWQKTYKVAVGSVEPAEVIKAWKARFPEFWPKGNRFYAPLTGLAPGEVAVLNLSMGGLKLSTGVLVMYADEESFTLMTPQGHMFCGWITFSAFRTDGVTYAQAQVLMRASDPIYEMGLAMGGHRKEDRFWEHTLRSLAGSFGAAGDVEVELAQVCVDRKRQWRMARNVWHNAAIRTTGYVVTAPFRLAARPFRRRKAG